MVGRNADRRPTSTSIESSQTATALLGLFANWAVLRHHDLQQATEEHNSESETPDQPTPGEINDWAKEGGREEGSLTTGQFRVNAFHCVMKVMSTQ